MPVILLPNSSVKATEHVPGSPVERLEADGSVAVRMLDVNWGDRMTAAKVILGYPVIAKSGANSYLKRYTPFAHPEWTSPISGSAFLYAAKVGIQGLAPLGKNSAGDTATYKTARLTVEYSTLPYEILTDTEMFSLGWVNASTALPDESFLTRYISKRINPAGEYFTIAPTANGGTFTYVGFGAVQQGIGKLIVNYNLAVTWHQIPELAVPCAFINKNLVEGTGKIEKSLGHMNNAVFVGFTKGSLLLLGAELRPYRSPFGDRLFDITYLFKAIQPGDGITHTHIFRPASNAFIEVVTSGGSNLNNQTPGISVYDWIDYKPLFRAQLS